jgi:tetratricopeptide (TPR) repeat protein
LDAEKNLTQLISEDQSMPEAFFQLGVTSAALGKTNEALKYLEQAISLKGANALYHYHRAIVLSQSGRKEDSIKAYEQTITLDDTFAEPLNNLAWLFATDADSKIRNGMRAVRLAERACELTAQKQAFLIGTLAAAYAEAGRFDEAAAAAQRAIELARTTGQNELATRNSELLELYRARQPYHEPLQALERK